VPVARSRGGALELPLQVSFQGCAEKGLCYPPITTTVNVSLGAGSGAVLSQTSGSAGGGGAEQDFFARLVRGNPLLMLSGFFVAGLVLAFTPCVLPMVPILAGIITGGRQPVTAGRGFMLSLTYVLGMACTYTVAGIACAAAGRQVQAVFQQWWVLALFAALFVAMALSMFGLFTVQMPAAIQTRIADVSNRQSAGTFGGVAVMGALSALIVTTCVGPALVGALLVISQTGQMARGGAALFAMSIGMGTPLLVVGASAGKLLPRAGPWMDLVKKVFGVMMLAVAVWMLARIVPDRTALLLWSVPVLVLAWLLLSETRRPSAAGWALRRGGVGRALRGDACDRLGARGHGPPGTHPGLCRQDPDPALPPGEFAGAAGSGGGAGARAGARRAGGLHRRLVHVVPGNGTLHLQRSTGAGSPARRGAAARRRHRKQRERSGAPQALRHLRATDHRVLRQ